VYLEDSLLKCKVLKLKDAVIDNLVKMQIPNLEELTVTGTSFPLHNRFAARDLSKVWKLKTDCVWMITQVSG
jgi:hypothetical protein